MHTFSRLYKRGDAEDLLDMDSVYQSAANANPKAERELFSSLFLNSDGVGGDADSNSVISDVHVQQLPSVPRKRPGSPISQGTIGLNDSVSQNGDMGMRPMRSLISQSSQGDHQVRDNCRYTASIMSRSTAVDTSSVLSLKIKNKFDGKIYRASLQPDVKEYTDLKKLILCTAVLEEKIEESESEHHNIEISYLDEDSDLVSLSNTAALHEARQMCIENNCTKLSIVVSPSKELKLDANADILFSQDPADGQIKSQHDRSKSATNDLIESWVNTTDNTVSVEISTHAVLAFFSGVLLCVGIYFVVGGDRSEQSDQRGRSHYPGPIRHPDHSIPLNGSYMGNFHHNHR